MTRNLVSPQLQASLSAMSKKLGSEIGGKIADRIARHKAKQSPSAPVRFKGNVPVAQFSVAEATALVDHLSIVNEYAENHAYLAGQGTSLYDFALDKFINGDAGEPTDEVLSALQKQSTEFANKHMASRSSQ